MSVHWLVWYRTCCFTTTHEIYIMKPIQSLTAVFREGPGQRPKGLSQQTTKSHFSIHPLQRKVAKSILLIKEHWLWVNHETYIEWVGSLSLPKKIYRPKKFPVPPTFSYHFFPADSFPPHFPNFPPHFSPSHIFSRRLFPRPMLFPAAFSPPNYFSPLADINVADTMLNALIGHHLAVLKFLVREKIWLLKIFIVIRMLCSFWHWIYIFENCYEFCYIKTSLAFCSSK